MFSVGIDPLYHAMAFNHEAFVACNSRIIFRYDFRFAPQLY